MNERTKTIVISVLIAVLLSTFVNQILYNLKGQAIPSSANFTPLTQDIIQESGINNINDQEHINLREEASNLKIDTITDNQLQVFVTDVINAEERLKQITPEEAQEARQLLAAHLKTLVKNNQSANRIAAGPNCLAIRNNVAFLRDLAVISPIFYVAYLVARNDAIELGCL